MSSEPTLPKHPIRGTVGSEVVAVSRCTWLNRIRPSKRRMAAMVVLMGGIGASLPMQMAWASMGQNSGGTGSPQPPAQPSEPSNGPQSGPEKNAPASGSAAPAQDPPRAPKSLDELLDVPVSGSSGDAGKAGDSGNSGNPGSAEDAARREQEKRLERSLDEANLQDLVRKALDGMKTASARLAEQNDPGLGTQRVQEDVVKTLQRLLDEAEKQQRQSSSSSSSSGSSSRSSGKQSKDGKSGDPKERNGQQRQSAQRRSQGTRSETTSGSGDSESDPGTRDSDAVAEAGELSETRVEWGQLPERVRELVLQGRRDRVSTLYERLTREYYRRLAEEASK